MSELDDSDLLMLKLIIITERLNHNLSRLEDRISSTMFKNQYFKGLLGKHVLGPDLDKFKARRTQFIHEPQIVVFE